jgi:hypothetical protein
MALSLPFGASIAHPKPDLGDMEHPFQGETVSHEVHEVIVKVGLTTGELTVRSLAAWSKVRRESSLSRAVHFCLSRSSLGCSNLSTVAQPWRVFTPLPSLLNAIFFVLGPFLLYGRAQPVRERADDR